MIETFFPHRFRTSIAHGTLSAYRPGLSSPVTPHEAFHDWLQDAINNDVKEAHAMTLSTIDEFGCPDARVLILKNPDHRGWHFAIEADSPKGRQINNNPAVALTFYWPRLGRQIRIRGEAKELPVSECAADFLERPIGSKVTALASRQSEILEDTTALEQGLQEAKQKIESQPGYVAPAWTVLAVAPKTVEFWQGATDRMHQRLRYSMLDGDETWVRDVLYP
ncbi:pyridoxamine 5'-phosphate oxidase [Aureobasidium sp. EXF-8845]|nr:pyridoxamine 5'-phosphate oxidase [Aureobasidium sp. EXF-8845]KAI4857884.1 pyridoxamine 5'-phosphate oxidase [Aureobasidium sp. EXF-8846]